MNYQEKTTQKFVLLVQAIDIDLYLWRKHCSVVAVHISYAAHMSDQFKEISLIKIYSSALSTKT